MDSFHEKLWFQRHLQRLAERLARELIEERGQALPCKIQSVSGQIVTVNFSTMDTTPFVLPPLTVPVHSSPYCYWPFQPGDTGVVRPADAHVDEIAGLTTSIPALTRRPANLSALVFEPVGKKSFAPINASAVQLQGPDGVICQTSDGSVSMVANSSGVTITAAGKTWTFTSTGFTMSTGIVAEAHVHTDPQGGVTGGPQAP